MLACCWPFPLAKKLRRHLRKWRSLAGSECCRQSHWLVMRTAHSAPLDQNAVPDLPERLPRKLLEKITNAT